MCSLLYEVLSSLDILYIQNIVKDGNRLLQNHNFWATIFALGPPDGPDAVGVAVPEGGAEAEARPGEGISPNGFLRNSARNFRQLPLDGTK